MLIRSPKRLLVAGAALTALAGLTACSAHPGSAAVIGSESISTDEVDDLAGTLCSTQTGGQGSQQPAQPLASRPAREGALDILVSTGLSQQFGEDVGAEADQEQVAGALAANQSTLDTLSESEQEIFTDALKAFVSGQLMLIEVGTESLGEQGGAEPNEEQALQEGTKLRDEWVADNLDVTVDPRYGEFSEGRFLPGSGSVSVPVSDDAKQAVAEQPSDDWVSSLPASQQCD